MLAAALVGCADGTSNWERDNALRLEREGAEAMPTPPAYPRGAGLREIAVRGAGGFRFYVDGATLAVEPNGIVRYVLVARSASGVDNVSFEAIRCASAEYRVYALGRPDGTWGGRPGAWRPIAAGGVQPWHTALQREYFCPQGAPIGSADEGRQALEQGGHPFVKGLGGDPMRPLGR